jgi:hypothetical protein
MYPQSQVEQLMVAEATPRLVQGEQILALGALLAGGGRRHRVLSDYDVLLVVATNLRLLLFEGKSSLGGLVVRELEVAATFGSDRPRHWPPPVVLEWWYQDLAAVEVMALGSFLTYSEFRVRLKARHPALGVGDGAEGDYYTISKFTGLPGHPQFLQQFLPWLAQQVAAGAFPLTPARQALVQQYEQAAQQHRHAAMAHAAAAGQRQAMAAQQQQESARRLHAKLGARSRGGFCGVLVLLGLGVLLLLAGAAAGVGATHDRSWRAERAGHIEELVEVDEEDVAWSEAGEPPPKGCPEKELEDRRELLHPDISWNDWDRYTMCHGCLVLAAKPSKPDDGKWKPDLERFERKGEVWFCPPAERYREQLAADKKRLASFREGAQSWNGVVASVVMALLGLVLFVVGISIVVRGRRAIATSGP